MPNRNANRGEEPDEREAKLRALRHAARQGFDELDRGSGIRLTGKHALARFFKQIVSEVHKDGAPPK